MIDLLRKFFQKTQDEFPGCKKEQQSHDPGIATCALLLEMANIDGEFSESEKESIIRIIKTEYQLTDDHAAALFQAADEQLKRSIDLWHFARLINQNYSEEEKIKIIEIIWQVIYTDGILDKHEDYLAHKLAKLLRLSHKQLIDAKLKVIHSS